MFFLPDVGWRCVHEAAATSLAVLLLLPCHRDDDEGLLTFYGGMQEAGLFLPTPTKNLHFNIFKIVSTLSSIVEEAF